MNGLFNWILVEISRGTMKGALLIPLNYPGAMLIWGATLIVFAKFSRGYVYLGGYAY